jgi:MFS family permease
MSKNKSNSLTALNWLNFFAADVSEGVGPFLAVYLATNLHWNPGSIGIAIAAMHLSMVFGQSPAGYLVDRTPHKRVPIIAATLLMGTTALLMIFFNNFYFIVGSQVVMGISGSFYLPSLVALATGIAPKGGFDRTISKNQSFNHSGNVAAAIFIGVVAKFTHNEGIFYCLIALSVLCAISALSISKEAVTQSPATKQTEGKQEKVHNKSLVKQVICNKAFLIFLLLTVIFYFSNGAMLPLVAQEIARHNVNSSTLYLAACIVIAQLTMVPTVYICGKQAGKGRKRLLIVAFILLAIRGILYIFTDKTIPLLLFEILDGMAAGTFSVTAIMVVNDLMGKSGRASFAQGMLATGLSFGSTLSNTIAGFIVNAFGFKIGFIFLTALALGAMFLLWKAMPETLEKEQEPDMRMQFAV